MKPQDLRAEIPSLLDRLEAPRPWDREPVFCFTSDIDWASEPALERFLDRFCGQDLKLTTFVTHESALIEDYKRRGLIERGIHPNFLAGSSHGNSFREVIETCLRFAPEAEAFRSHRLFDVTDITHMLHFDYGFRYVSNLGTILQRGIRPILHESGLVHFPIYFEDGTHLFNRLSLSMADLRARFLSPGIKIISVHPMNYVINTPEIAYMRNIKDTLTRDEYNLMSHEEIDRRRHRGRGISDLVDEIIELAQSARILSLGEIYRLAVARPGVEA